MTGRSIHTYAAPQPAGTYSQGVECGRLVFLSGQTPRDRDGKRLSHLPFADQVRRALNNLEAVAGSVGLSLKDAVKVTVYLRNFSDRTEFDEIYKDYVAHPWPARTLVQ